MNILGIFNVELIAIGSYLFIATKVGHTKMLTKVLKIGNDFRGLWNF